MKKSEFGIEIMNVSILCWRMVGALRREKQKKIKELKNSIIKIVKENIKPYGFKTKDYMIWCIKTTSTLLCCYQ